MQEYRPQTVIEHHEGEGAEGIDAFEQFEHGDIVEIEPGKFCMVKDEEKADGSDDSKIELMRMQDKLSYGDLDTSAPIDANVKVCTQIIKGISFDEISLSSLKKLRRQNKKLRRMSNISSLDSDTKVFNEIWNAVKQDKFDSQNSTHIKGDSLSSDAQIFNVLQKNKSLSKSDSSNSNKTQVFKPTHATIHEFAESYPGSTVSSVASFDLPENPEASPVYYPASEPQIPPDFHQKSQDSDGKIVSEAQGKLSKSQEANVDELREKCSSRTEPCHCQCDVISLFHLSFLSICCAYVQGSTSTLSTNCQVRISNFFKLSFEQSEGHINNKIRSSKFCNWQFVDPVDLLPQTHDKVLEPRLCQCDLFNKPISSNFNIN